MISTTGCFICLRRELLDKKATQSVANNINYRHRIAQYASRASVNLHTHIFFRNQRRDETGYVLFVRQNAVQVSPRPHRGINKSAKSGFKTPGFINFRFSQDVKEVMR